MPIDRQHVLDQGNQELPIAPHLKANVIMLITYPSSSVLFLTVITIQAYTKTPNKDNAALSTHHP